MPGTPCLLYDLGDSADCKRISRKLKQKVALKSSEYVVEKVRDFSYNRNKKLLILPGCAGATPGRLFIFTTECCVSCFQGEGK